MARYTNHGATYWLGVVPIQSNHFAETVRYPSCMFSTADFVTTLELVKGPAVEKTSVLCPIDFSPASLAAVALAVDEANRRDAVVDLLHVWEPSVGYVTEFAPIPIEPVIPIESIQADLSTIAVDLPADRVRRHVASGDPATEIIEMANKLHSELVVMGTHARRGLARWIIGSVCDHVLQHSPCPVLVCRGPEKAD